MPKIVIIRGAICTGKTTITHLLRKRLLHYALIEPDILKEMVDNGRSSLWRRKVAEKTILFLIAQLMEYRRNIIVALHSHSLLMYNLIKKLAHEYSYKSYPFLLVAPLEVVLIRSKNRGVPKMRYLIPKSKIDLLPNNFRNEIFRF